MNNIIQNAIETGVPNVSKNLNTDINDILLLPEVPCQRDHLRRVKKMNEHFIKPVKSKHEFTIFNVTNGFNIKVYDEITFVEEGVYLANGNTRAESKRQLDSGKNNIGYNPEHPVITTIVTINTPKQLLDEYYSIDTAAATEGSADIVRGSIKLLEMDISSKKGMSGMWGTALNAAYPGDNKDEHYKKMAYFKHEIVLLDESGMWNTNPMVFG